MARKKRGAASTRELRPEEDIRRRSTMTPELEAQWDDIVANYGARWQAENEAYRASVGKVDQPDRGTAAPGVPQPRRATVDTIYPAAPADSELTSALDTGVLISDLFPALMRKVLNLLRPIRMLVGTFITPEMYGAVGDGVADDTAALTSAFAALVPGATLYLGPGRVYNHSTQLVTPTGVNGYTIAGGGTLFATNLNASALRIRGDNVWLQSFTKEKAATNTRVDPYEAQNIVCDGCKNLPIVEVTSRGGSGTGFFLTRLNGFKLIRLVVDNTLADGIHMTGGSQNGKVIDPRVWMAGDDGVSCVGYMGGSDPGVVKFIDIINPVVLGSKAGRGVTCVGAEDIRVYNVTIENTFAAGIYIASENYGGNSIGACARILFSGGTIRKANTNYDPAGVAGAVDHGAILISAEVANQANTDIMVENMNIFDTRAANPWECSVMAGGGNNTNVTLRKISMNGVVGATWFLGAWNGGVNTNVRRVLPWDIFTNDQLATAA